MPRPLTIVFSAFAFGAAGPALAEPTEVTIRVQADDAKFIGTGMGGARVVIRDAETDAILAQGVTQGGTGDTAALVGRPRERHAPVAGPGDAGFTATLDIDEPRLVRIEVAGPLAQPQTRALASQTRWVLPGRSPHGPDGLIVNLPGLSVDALSPAAYAREYAVGDEVPILANIVHLCGCPLTPGGTWNAEAYEVGYTVEHNGRAVGGGTLAYAGTASRFEGRFAPPASGAYEITVTAHHPPTGNSGVDRTTIIVP